MIPPYAEHRARLADCVARPHPYPDGRFAGRGVVVCAGGERYFTNAYVCASVLRMHGCRLPIQFWHLGPEEMTDEMRGLVAHLGVTCVDGRAVRDRHPARILNGWELKPYAVIHSPFEEVLLLDADNVAVRDPSYLFDDPRYREAGAAFWPDFGRLAPDRAIWDILGVEYRDEPECETGQLVVDKRLCWKPLQVAMHLNEWSDFYYHHIHGDKDTFHLAWRKLGRPYAMPDRGIEPLDGTMCQHDFDGRRLFQHRNTRKWELAGRNDPVPGFEFEAECLGFLDELRARWSAAGRPARGPAADALAARVAAQRDYLYCRVGYDYRPIQLLPNGRVAAGAGAAEETWRVIGPDDAPRVGLFTAGRLLCDLEPGGADMLHGRWVAHERMPVVLLPAADPGRAEPATWAAQYGEDRWVAAHIPLPDAGVFVEVGAADGLGNSNTYWLERRGWAGLLVEADARNLPHVAACRRVPVAFCAASDRDGEVRFVRHHDHTLSGCRRADSDGTVVTVPARRLDTLLAERGIDRVDLMSIDTEGSELDVLAGLGAVRPAVLIVEYWTAGLDGGPGREGVTGRLAEMRYEVVHATPSNLIARYRPAGVAP